MGKGGGSAPSPDPKIGEAALLQAQTGEQWMAFAKDAFKVSTDRQTELDALTKKVTDQQLGIGDFSLKNAKADRARYEAKGIPAQDAFAKEAGEYGSKAKEDAAAAEAGAGVQTQAAAAREQARREQGAMGVKPGSGRASGIDRAGELGTVAATAGAMNNARTQRRDKALALKADVANMYAGLPAQSGAAAGQALAAGSGAVGMNQNNQQISNSNAAGMHTGFGGQMQGYAGQASTLLNQYGLDIQKWQAQQEANSAGISGIGNAIGTFAGLAVASDPKKKKNIKSTKSGAGLEAVKKMPIKSFDYKSGEGDGGRGHVGTMAPAFAKATGQPDTGVIRLQDALGITMKAVQDLDKKVDKLAPKGSKASKAKSKSAPAARRSSQSPAKARPTKAVAAKAVVTPKNAALGIRRT
jgi:hypothetical protein